MILDKIIYRLLGFDEIEKKLMRYGGYRGNQIIQWKREAELSWVLTKKILLNLTIYNSSDIRELLRTIVNKNNELFNDPNTYICGFGNCGKSGDVILYEFSHAFPKLKDKIIRQWELNKLETNSNVIFLDDLIGTGRQSVEYILEKLNLLVKPSFNCYLICLCGTQDGINKVSDETNFKVISSIVLEKEKYMFCTDDSQVFSRKEKDTLISLNEKLKNPKKEDFNKGLLVAFQYGIPNNTMPIIWKDGFQYIKANGTKKKWLGILPRQF